MFGMANLRPVVTGLKFTLHVYKNEDRRARHGPRVKVFPGKPHEGNATVITVPRNEIDVPEVVGDPTLSKRQLRDVIDFIRRNFIPLLAYWYEPDFDEETLRAVLER